MREKDLVAGSALVSGYARKGGRCLEAVEVFKEMCEQGFKADGTTVSSVLSAVGELGDFGDLGVGVMIHGYAWKHGLGSDKWVVSALIDMYGKCGSTVEMLRVFDEMGCKDVGACNALISGFARNGLNDEALEAFKRLRGRELEQNVVSWTSIIACCSQHGKDIEALKLFREMQVCGVKPNSITIPCLLPACGNIAALMHGKSAHGFSLRTRISNNFYVGSALIDMYANCERIKLARVCFDKMSVRRAGKLKEAYSTIEKMPCEPEACVWGALLSSCRVHNNMELAEVAANKIFELEPKNPGNYGCSWIEIKNKVHTLLVGDRSHPQMIQIIEKMDNLSMEMKKAGCLPVTSFVLQDVKDQEKEHILYGHSEKLAVVLGILNTPKGATLQVIKNLRICEDCHDVIKFISMIEQREILVRDTNHFHHFKDGLCSCGDYW
ncbi:pentatricopeptide repeat-containing protein [Tanacetum coccineum]